MQQELRETAILVKKWTLLIHQAGCQVAEHDTELAWLGYLNFRMPRAMNVVETLVDIFYVWRKLEEKRQICGLEDAINYCFNIGMLACGNHGSEPTRMLLEKGMAYARLCPEIANQLAYIVQEFEELKGLGMNEDLSCMAQELQSITERSPVWMPPPMPSAAMTAAPSELAEAEAIVAQLDVEKPYQVAHWLTQCFWMIDLRGRDYCKRKISRSMRMAHRWLQEQALTASIQPGQNPALSGAA